MPSLVISQMPLRREAHLTVSEVAPEWLLPVVNPHMRKQVALFPESFLASLHLTYKWPLACL